MPIVKRSQLLLDAGYTREQIIKRVLEVAEIRRLRAESTLDISSSSKNNNGFGKFSKDFVSGFSNFAKIGVGPKPTKAITVTARTA
mmetsp:Transcript_14392/g.14226  ORF Transcript_14392/g.14226 Transcript_14392/m.14226 type:complete len:86 (-) Transcript_14392:53-310(-)